MPGREPMNTYGPVSGVLSVNKKPVVAEHRVPTLETVSTHEPLLISFNTWAIPGKRFALGSRSWCRIVSCVTQPEG